MATEQIPTGLIANDAVTGDKIENNPTVAGNLTVAGATNLASVATGTLASAVVFPAGHVIQSQHVFMDSDMEHTNATLTQVTDGTTSLLKAITPIKANSKIMVMLSTTISGGTSNTQGYLQLQRKIASGSYGAVGGGGDLGSNRKSAIANGSTNNVEHTNQVGYHFFDSPSYTVGNEITYRIMCAAQDGGYSFYIGRARQSNDASYVPRMPSTLTLFEIAV